MLLAKGPHDAELIYLRLFITGSGGLLAVIASLLVAA
jgi:hypothetical protein